MIRRYTVAALCSMLGSGALAGEHWAVVIDTSQAPSVRAAVISEVGSRPEKWTDATEIAAGVRGFRGMVAPDFDRAPPRGWPDSLRDAWAKGTATCKARMGDLTGGMRDPGFASKVVDGNDCAQRLETALWNRWLRTAGITRVIEVSVGTTRSGQADVFASTYRREDAQQLTARANDVARGAVDKEARRLVAGVLAGSGITAPRGTSIELPAAMASEIPELNAGAVHTDFEPLAPPATCKALPAKLELSPGSSSFARTLAARWEASARGTGAALPCTLSGTTGMAEGLVPTRTLMVNLQCAGTTHRGEVALMKLNKEPWDILTAQLIKSIYNKECSR